MRFRLRTLLLVTAIVPLLVGGGIRAYWAYKDNLKSREVARFAKLIAEFALAVTTEADVDLTEIEDESKVVLHQLEHSQVFIDDQERTRQIAAICDVIRAARKRQQAIQDILSSEKSCAVTTTTPAPPSWLSIICDDCFPTANP